MMIPENEIFCPECQRPLFLLPGGVIPEHEPFMGQRHNRFWFRINSDRSFRQVCDASSRVFVGWPEPKQPQQFDRWGKPIHME